LLLVAFVWLALLTLSVFDNSFNIGKLKLRNLSIISDLVPDIIIPQRVVQNHLIIKSLSLDSNEVCSNIDSLRVQLNQHENIINYNENQSLLENFFTRLHQVEKQGKTARIGYFGDSMIEGDLITQTLRNYYQKKFGGSGVGYVPVTSHVADFRKTIIHKFSDNWQLAIILRYNSEIRYGLAGYTFFPTVISQKDYSENTIPEKADKVTYAAATSSYSALRSFHKMLLLYGKTDSLSKVVINVDDNLTYTYPLTGKNAVNSIVFEPDYPFKSVETHFATFSKSEIYGFSFESKNGVFLDNYSLRGSSGLPLSAIRQNVIQGFNTELNYNLIILQFGLNVANENTENFAGYKQGMIKVVNYLKQCMPETDILLISVGDRSYKKDMELETMPSVPRLVDVQREVAQKTGIAFWNLFEAMGGEKSMVAWAHADPPLAAKDYTHLNFRGADSIATLLWKNLDLEYKLFKTQGKRVVEQSKTLGENTTAEKPMEKE